MTMTIPGSDPDNPDEVRVQIVALRQLDADGNTLGAGGSAKHSFNSFATQEFTFGAPQAATYQGLSTQEIEFESVLVGNSNLNIKTMIFQEAGNLTVGDDTFAVAPGAIKFNVELGTWSWCGDAGVSCVNADGAGAAVELDIEMYRMGSEPQTKADDADSTTSESYDLGNGQELVLLSTYSDTDGSTWTQMPSGFPSLDGSTFTLKFPRWTSSKVIYDPIIAYGGDDALQLSDSSSSTRAAAGGLVVALAFLHAFGLA